MTSRPSSSPFEDLNVATPDALASSSFTVGLDIGQTTNPSAVAIVRRIEDAAGRLVYQIGHLERLPLEMPYPQQVSYVAGLMSRLRSPNVELVLDVTGVGRAVGDLFAVAGLAPIGVTITAGDAVTSEGLNFHVPKLNLVSRLQALLHNGQLKIHKHLADAGALVNELQSFRAEVSASGHWRFGSRSGKHDDLVLATAIALWRSHGDVCFQSWGLYEYMRTTYGNGGTDRGLTALPPPLEPLESPIIERPPVPKLGPDFGYSTAPVARPVVVTLKPPAAISSATGLSGRAYVPDRNGFFHMTVEDSRPLIANGWTRIEPAPAPTARWRP
jgi:hypothetical protein